MLAFGKNPSCFSISALMSILLPETVVAVMFGDLEKISTSRCVSSLGVDSTKSSLTPLESNYDRS